MHIFIETDRLILRELLPSDAEGMFELDSDPEVHRYLGNNPIRHVDQAKQIIDHVRRQYVDVGIGRWAMEEKETGNFLGWAGLKLNREPMNNHVDYYDVGYRLLKKHWGRGYATEAAKASLDYGLSRLNLTDIYGIADANNLASRKVLEKIGLQFVEAFDFEGDPHFWYKVSRI
jgi:ribosomal-protein-alanine N-acetyltransferase